MIHINSLLIAYLSVYLVSSALDLIIDKLNANHLQKCGEKVPEAFEGFIDKKELKSRKQRIEQIVNGELAGKAAKEAIEAMQAAVMVAAIMPAIISSTVTSSVAT